MTRTIRMARIFVGASLLGLLSGVGWAQAAAPAASTPPAAPTQFVAADVHASPYSFFSTYFHPAPIAGDRYVLHQATLLDLITYAYNVEDDSVSGGPPWLEFDRFDIVAKVPPATTQAATREMVKALLADRFKLVVRTETKPLAAFLLKPGKGATKMKATANDAADPGCQYMPPSPPPPPGTMITSATFTCHNMTMDKFVEILRNLGWAYLNHPVVDATGLKGAWDFDIKYSFQPGMPDGISIFDAVEKQLGLKLEAGLAPRLATYIVSVADKPTPNPPGIEKLLPPAAPKTFDVAVIKPTAPGGARDLQTRMNGSGQVTFAGGTLQQLIGYAWDVSGAMVVDGPPTMTKLHWDIMAKMPQDADSANPAARQQMNIDDMKEMLRALLEERFGLKMHHEDRTIDAYVLLAGSPKLKKADPANRTSCSGRPAAGEKDPRLGNPLLTRLMVCQNITMDQFAPEIMQYSLDYVKTPPLNQTKLEGRYDLTLAWSDLRTTRQPAAGAVGTPGAAAAPAEGGPAAASDPSAAITLPDAVAKELGLKLEMQKRPAPVLVIDHLEEKPTDN